MGAPIACSSQSGQAQGCAMARGSRHRRGCKLACKAPFACPGAGSSMAVAAAITRHVLFLLRVPPLTAARSVHHPLCAPLTQGATLHGSLWQTEHCSCRIRRSAQVLCQRGPPIDSQGPPLVPTRLPYKAAAAGYPSRTQLPHAVVRLRAGPAFGAGARCPASLCAGRGTSSGPAW